MKDRFDNKVVWITGGGSGLGMAMALRFAREGARVAVSGRRKERLDKVVREIEANGGRGLAVPCDVAQEQQLIEAVEQISKTFGGLDVAVANAATAARGPAENTELEAWQRVFETNVFGLAMMAKHALPELRKTKGRLVLIGSGAALSAFPGAAIYTASKYAARAIGQTLAMELHSSGVSCTIIHPGFLDTELIRVDNRGKVDPDIKIPKSPLMWSAEKAAKVCVNAIYKRKREHGFSALVRIMSKFGYHMPGLYHFFMTRFGSRAGMDFVDKPDERK